MKINPRNIDNFLNNEFKKFKATLFYGNNIGLVHKRIDRISKKFLVDSNDQEVLNQIKINYSELAREPDMLLNEIRTLSFFGSKKIILISEVSGVIPKQLEKTLLEENNSDVLVIFYGGQLLPKDQVRKLFESSQQLASVPCYLEESFSIEREAITRLKEAGIETTDTEAIKYVAINVGGDSASISTELDKIVSFYNRGDKISTDEVRNIISKSSTDADADKYISFLMLENFSSAEAELEKLILAGIKLPFLIKALSRYFTRLYVAHGLITEGISESEVASKLKPPIFFKNIPTFKLALKKYSAQKTIEVLEQLLYLEIKIKTHDTTLAKIIFEKELFEMFIAKK
jgi:DNA polymerase III subunit delta